MRDPNVKPEWWCVAIDETRYYNIDEEDKPYIEKMVGVYYFDRAEYTYCCEVTPSYLLMHLSNELYYQDLSLDQLGEDLKHGLPGLLSQAEYDAAARASEERRDRLCQKYCYCGNEDMYIHVRDVERISAEQKRAFGDVPDDVEDQSEYVREYWQGNCPF